MTQPGTRLAAVMRCLLHRDTFETMASPALADLQAECAGSWRTHLRHCAGLGVVLSAGLLRDWRTDVLTAFDPGARRDVWCVAGIWYMVPTTLLAGLVLKQQTPWHLLDAAVWPAVAVEAVLGARLYASHVGAVAAAFFLSRRLSAIKALIISVAAVTFAFAVLNAAASVTRAPLNRAIYETSRRNLAAAPLPLGDPSSWDNQRWPRWVERHGRQAENAATPAEIIRWFAVVAPLAALLNFLPFALVGLALAGGRGGTVLLRLAAVIAVTVAIYQFKNPPSAWENQGLQYLRQIGAVTAAALFCIGVGPLARLIAAPFRAMGDWGSGPRPV